MIYIYIYVWKKEKSNLLNIRKSFTDKKEKQLIS